MLLLIYKVFSCLLGHLHFLEHCLLHFHGNFFWMTRYNEWGAAAPKELMTYASNVSPWVRMSGSKWGSLTLIEGPWPWWRIPGTYRGSLAQIEGPWPWGGGSLALIEGPWPWSKVLAGGGGTPKNQKFRSYDEALTTFSISTAAFSSCTVDRALPWFGGARYVIITLKCTS